MTGVTWNLFVQPFQFEIRRFVQKGALVEQYHPCAAPLMVSMTVLAGDLVGLRLATVVTLLQLNITGDICMVMAAKAELTLFFLFKLFVAFFALILERCMSLNHVTWHQQTIENPKGLDGCIWHESKHQQNKGIWKPQNDVTEPVKALSQ